MQKNQQNDPVEFFHFPGPKRNPEKRMWWIKACKLWGAYWSTRHTHKQINQIKSRQLVVYETNFITIKGAVLKQFNIDVRLQSFPFTKVD